MKWSKLAADGEPPINGAITELDASDFFLSPSPARYSQLVDLAMAVRPRAPAVKAKKTRKLSGCRVLAIVKPNQSVGIAAQRLGQDILELP